MFLRLIHYFYIIKTYFKLLPKDLQIEIVETFEEYKNLVLINKILKFERSENERTRENCRNQKDNITYL